MDRNLFINVDFLPLFTTRLILRDWRLWFISRIVIAFTTITRKSISNFSLSLLEMYVCVSNLCLSLSRSCASWISLNLIDIYTVSFPHTNTFFICLTKCDFNYALKSTLFAYREGRRSHHAIRNSFVIKYYFDSMWSFCNMLFVLCWFPLTAAHSILGNGSVQMSQTYKFDYIWKRKCHAKYNKNMKKRESILIRLVLFLFSYFTPCLFLFIQNPG